MAGRGRDRAQPAQSKASAALLKSLKIGAGDRRWIQALRGKDLHNGALVAIDYRTGDVLAYAGSAGYYRDDLASPKFEPKFDAAGDGARQPGSAFKPIVYASAFDTPEAHAGQPAARRHDPVRAEGLGAARRRPARSRARSSFGRPSSTRSTSRPSGPSSGSGTRPWPTRADDVRASASPAAATAFLQAGLAGAIGTVEVRPLDLTSAYGATRQRRRPRADRG